MQERIIEIIMYLISELRQNQNVSLNDFASLRELGFSNTEISTALSWLIDKTEFTSEAIVNPPLYENTSFRILHETEKDIFTKEAWGKILQMNSLGILPNEYIELMIEKAEAIGLRQIDETHLKHFIANTIFNLQLKDRYGSRIMLNTNDTIN